MSNRSKSGQTKKRNRGLLSCHECHRRKQKCNRERPCSDCVERGLPERCIYQAINNPNQLSSANDGVPTISRLKRILTGEEVILTTESVYALAETSTVVAPHPRRHADPDQFPFLSIGSFNTSSAGSSFLHNLTMRSKSPNVASGLYYAPPLGAMSTFDPFSMLPEMVGEPVPQQLLIRYYLERLAPWFCYLDDNLSDIEPRIAWLPFALEHKPFFYATLLTAAVHLNRKRRFRDPAALLWFKAETIRAANEKMNDPAEAASDEMIMVALILLVFNVGGGNTEEFEIHLRGINEMVKLRGGMQGLGMRGMVKNWLLVCYGPWHDGWEYGHFS
ncbi:hypothetical protein N431DRAFT_558921 [Stipitochalara longipes BDJ]|nr:hypothetical protein N431DRAFT_558921 [Stipitochalara longipes BDJ]